MTLLQTKTIPVNPGYVTISNIHRKTRKETFPFRGGRNCEISFLLLFLVDRTSINLKSNRFLNGDKPRDTGKLSCTSLRQCLRSLGSCGGPFGRPPEPWTFNGSAVVLGTREASQGTYSSSDVACKLGLQAQSSQLLREGHHLATF